MGVITSSMVLYANACERQSTWLLAARSSAAREASRAKLMHTELRVEWLLCVVLVLAAGGLAAGVVVPVLALAAGGRERAGLQSLRGVAGDTRRGGCRRPHDRRGLSLPC